MYYTFPPRPSLKLVLFLLLFFRIIFYLSFPSIVSCISTRLYLCEEWIQREFILQKQPNPYNPSRKQEHHDHSFINTTIHKPWFKARSEQWKKSGKGGKGTDDERDTSREEFWWPEKRNPRRKGCLGGKGLRRWRRRKREETGKVGRALFTLTRIISQFVLFSML